MPLWWVWDAFGEANGVASDEELRLRLSRLSRESRSTLAGDDRPIGCVSITQPVFFAPDEWVPTPADWKPNIVSGAGYDLTMGEGRILWERCLERAAAVGHAPEWVHEAEEQRRYGQPYLMRQRLGQTGFRIAVLEAYGHACAITAEHSLPVVEAAHIRPYKMGGTHIVANGLPLRRDLHRLFDLGFVTIRPDLKLAVSPRLREDYANGRAYYALEGTAIRTPTNPEDRPSRELLEWHSDVLFKR